MAIAQLLVLCATLLGVEGYYEKMKEILKKREDWSMLNLSNLSIYYKEVTVLVHQHVARNHIPNLISAVAEMTFLDNLVETKG